MLGAIIGDIVGSIYEGRRRNIKTKEFPLFGERCRFTDDTVMTMAVAEVMLYCGYPSDIATRLEGNTGAIMGDALLYGDHPLDYARAMRWFGRLYPHAGYGRRFKSWLFSDDRQPYNSWGNGSAMRVSPVGWWFDSLEQTEYEAELSAAVTHNHPEGIKGAQATAAAIYLARNGKSKEEIRTYIESTYDYNLSRRLDEIRPSYSFDVSCMGTVPEAIIAFLESNDFEDAIRNAISLGGDSDTLTAITGSIAEAAYGIPENIKAKALSLLDGPLLEIWKRWESCLIDISNWRSGAVELRTKTIMGMRFKYLPNSNIFQIG